MKRLFFLMLYLCLVKLSFASGKQITEHAGNKFDTGCIYISSCAIKGSGESTFSLTNPALTGTNNKYKLKNKGPYEVMIDSCVWSDKGTIALLGTEQPWLIEVESIEWLNSACETDVHMRALTILAGWTTMQYQRVWDGY